MSQGCVFCHKCASYKSGACSKHWPATSPSCCPGYQKRGLSNGVIKLVREALKVPVGAPVPKGVTVRLRFKHQGKRRNQPCPCGSGKKMKSCCLGRVINTDEINGIPEHVG